MKLGAHVQYENESVSLACTLTTMKGTGLCARGEAMRSAATPCVPQPAAKDRSGRVPQGGQARIAYRLRCQPPIRLVVSL